MWTDRWGRACWYCGSTDSAPYWKMGDRPELTQTGAHTVKWEEDDGDTDLDRVLVRWPGSRRIRYHHGEA